jgi:hypothetical protein
MAFALATPGAPAALEVLVMDTARLVPSNPAFAS